ncbi:MAG: SusC/RagA family TonB-linked outer membrane protein [Tannerellaceae bacterium]|nr:SusC/RagA family TonB-linked outer membrane protein [Tannerellaceae bacterium]
MKREQMQDRSKWTQIFLILLLTAVSTQWLSAKISLVTEQTTLGAVINQIKAQTEYQFFYEDRFADLPVKAVVMENASLDQILDEALKDLNVSYKIEDNIVWLSEKKASSPKVTVTQQEQQVTGTVTDSFGEPLIGVNVVVKGTTNGTITNFDGEYSLMVSDPEAIIVFSYIGYKPQEFPLNGQSVIDVVLMDDTQLIGEVVVTALGIKREKKMLGYAVQDVKADELNLTGDPSVTSALQGKVAGLQMNTSSTGLGGSTKITIRGNSSLTDNNQPLWIVDGVPFSDSNSSDASFFGGIDRGGSAVDINPEDIESISVLKGPNAAALYGSRAGNGVILVTTKKGTRKEGFGVNYSGNFTWSSVAETLDMQTRYGQGTKGVYNAASSSSFGGVLDGHLVEAWNGEQIPYSYYGNKLKDYFNTGFSNNHNVSVGNVTETSHFRGSFGSSSSKGMFPNEKLEKINVDLNTGMEFNKYLSMDAKVSLSRTKGENRPYYGSYGAVAQLINIPHNVRLSDLQQYSTEDRVHVNWFGPDASYRNPYYVADQFRNEDERWRAFGYYGMKVNFTDWLHLSAKYAFDYYRTRLQNTDGGGGTGGETKPGDITNDHMTRGEENFFESNAEFILIGDNRINDDFRIGYTLGANFMYQNFESLSASVNDMVDKNSWMFNAAQRLTSASNIIRKRATNSIFASVQFSFRDYLALDLTARNDWSSTLPTNHNSFFYPSANLSFVVSDFMNSIDNPLPNWVTFAKVRLSVAQVGKDTDPYQLYNTYNYKYENAQLVPDKSNIKLNDQLKPEISSSYEGGLDMKFFNNRFGFDFTYYYSETKNQIMRIPAAAPWSGGQIVNAGLISNKGFELSLYSTPVQTKDFTFDLNVNLSKNTSKVKELAEGVDYMFFSGDSYFPVNVGTRVGRPLGEIYAKSLFKRSDDGQLIINDRGRPVKVASDNALEYILDNPIGNIEPKLLMSVAPSFTYKGISLSALFDMKFGGDIVSVSEAMATASGLAKRTENRGEGNDWIIVVPGVHYDGSANTIPMEAERYYQSIGGSSAAMAEEFVYSASYIKLKELAIGYRIPSKVLKNTPINNLSLSFVARNLAYLLKHTPGTSPEGGYDVTMFSQAIDFTAVPYSRTFGFSVNVGF